MTPSSPPSKSGQEAYLNFSGHLDFLAPQLRASTGFGLDGGLMAKHHVIGMRALPSELWFDNYMIAAGETTDFEVIKIILKHVTEKYPNMRHVVMDSATYNIKVWFCVFSVLLFIYYLLFILFFFLSQGASEAATELLIFLCVGHGIHNIMKNFVKKHYPAVWELVVLLRKAFFNAPTRASRYISAQKAQNLAAPSANGPHEKAYQEFQNILGASSFVLPDTLSTMLAKFFVTYPSITPGTLEETEKLLGDLHQTETAEPKAKSMVDSKGTRWNSLTKLLRHVSERRLAIMAFCAEERQKYGASVCKSIRALVQLLHDTDTVSLWEQVVACSEVMDVPSKLMDGVADPSGTVPPILTLHTSFEKMTTELSSMEHTGAKELGTELGNFFRKHKNFPQISPQFPPIFRRKSPCSRPFEVNWSKCCGALEGGVRSQCFCWGPGSLTRSRVPCSAGLMTPMSSLRDILFGISGKCWTIRTRC